MIGLNIRVTTNARRCEAAFVCTGHDVNEWLLEGEGRGGHQDVRHETDEFKNGSSIGRIGGRWPAERITRKDSVRLRSA